MTFKHKNRNLYQYNCLFHSLEDEISLKHRVKKEVEEFSRTFFRMQYALKYKRDLAYVNQSKIYS